MRGKENRALSYPERSSRLSKFLRPEMKTKCFLFAVWSYLVGGSLTLSPDTGEQLSQLFPSAMDPLIEIILPNLPLINLSSPEKLFYDTTSISNHPNAQAQRIYPWQHCHAEAATCRCWRLTFLQSWNLVWSNTNGSGELYNSTAQELFPEEASNQPHFRYLWNNEKTIGDPEADHSLWNNLLDIRQRIFQIQLLYDLPAGLSRSFHWPDWRWWRDYCHLPWQGRSFRPWLTLSSSSQTVLLRFPQSTPTQLSYLSKGTIHWCCRSAHDQLNVRNQWSNIGQLAWTAALPSVC